MSTEEFKLNPELAEKFNAECLALYEQKGETASLSLTLDVKRLHKIKKPAIREYFEQSSDDRALELLLAFVGYDKTMFSQRKPLSEAVVEALIKADLDDKVFYHIVYADFKISARDIQLISKEISSDDLVAVSMFSKNVSVAISKLIRQLVKHRLMICKKLSEEVRENRRDLDGLAMVFPEEFSGDFENLLDNLPERYVVMRIFKIAKAFLAGEICGEEFTRIFALPTEKIIPELNKAVAAAG